MCAPNLTTKRLLLRQWKESDLPLFAQMNADPVVMEYFAYRLTTKESHALAQRLQQELEEKQYGLWAVEWIDKAPFIGFVGLHQPDFDAPFTPCIEIAWRIDKPFWRQGFAYEAAQKVVEYAFNTLKLPELIAFTTRTNFRSRSLMEKLGMTHDPHDDFDHPKLPQNHPLRRHVLYRLTSK